MARSAAGEILANIALPYAVYVYAKPALGDVKALLASSAPPLLWSLITFARKRRVDVLSLFVLAGIALSLVAFLGGGSVRFLQLRENLVSAAFGLAFLISAAIGKPLIYELARATARRKSTAEAATLEGMRDNAGFRHVMMLMTIVWGAGLLLQTAIACVLVFVLSIPTYLIVSPILGYGTMGALGVWTYWYGERRKRLAAASRAAAARESS